MSKQYCVFCHNKHQDYAWRYAKWWDEELKEEIWGMACTKHFQPSPSREFVPQAVKNDRVKYFNSLLKPWRGGEASKEFLEAYPNKAKKIFSQKEIKSAKNVWSDLSGHATRKKSL